MFGSRSNPVASRAALTFSIHGKYVDDEKKDRYIALFGTHVSYLAMAHILYPVKFVTIVPNFYIPFPVSSPLL